MEGQGFFGDGAKVASDVDSIGDSALRLQGEDLGSALVGFRRTGQGAGRVRGSPDPNSGVFAMQRKWERMSPKEKDFFTHRDMASGMKMAEEINERIEAKKKNEGRNSLDHDEKKQIADGVIAEMTERHELSGSESAALGLARDPSKWAALMRSRDPAKAYEDRRKKAQYETLSNLEDRRVPASPMD